MDGEEESKQKKDYLRKAIIEGGYNPDKFAQYLLSIKEDNDINNWTIEELKIGVDNFSSRNSWYIQNDTKEDGITEEGKGIEVRRSSGAKTEDSPKKEQPEIRKDVPILKVKPPDDLKSVFIKGEDKQSEANIEQNKAFVKSKLETEIPLVITQSVDPLKIDKLTATIIEYASINYLVSK